MVPEQLGPRLDPPPLGFADLDVHLFERGAERGEEVLDRPLARVIRPTFRASGSGGTIPSGNVNRST